jgi:hypothetical protein
MTLYAVHYAWIEDHATKAPVGIWSEGGVSFYPAEMESHRKGGGQAETETAKMLWSHWVQKRTEYGSTYGASWRAIESDEPMATVLAEVQFLFFAVAHPVKKILIPDGENEESKEDFESLEEDPDASEEEEEEEEEEESHPAQRFILAQSWWVGAELVRRHPELILHESHPGGGQYDVLAAFTLPYGKALTHVMLNRAGTMQVHLLDGHNGAPEVTRIGTWAEALSAQSPHEMVKRIEHAAQLATTTKASKSAPRALAYRFIATLLTMTVNDRHVWDARNDFIDTSGDEWWPGDPEVHGFTDGFPGAREDFPSTPEIGLWQEPNSHFWALLRDEIPVALVSIEGRVYRKGVRLDLAHEYAANGRRMLPLVASILGDLLV